MSYLSKYKHENWALQRLTPSLGACGHRLLLTIALALLVYITYGFFCYWAHPFSSDQALIGLMAKYIAEAGERPIFVWHVGYQGVFMEGYPTALVFHFFGLSPATLNAVTIVYFWLALALFYLLVRRLFSPHVAALALLFTIASSPLIFYVGMRSLPNFSSTFLLGMLMLLLYQRIVARVYLQKILDQKSLLYVLLFGVTAGFALYTYVLSAYFFLAAGFCSFIMYLGYLSAWCPTGWWRQLLMPSRGIRGPWLKVPLSCIFSACLILAASGAVLFAAGVEFNLVLAAGKRPVEPIHLLAGGLVLHLALGFVVNFIRWQRQKAKRALGGIILLIGMCAGFSPSLYYWFVLGRRSVKGAALSGNIEQLQNRWHIGFGAVLQLLNLPDDSWRGTWVASVTLASFCVFVGLFIQSLRRIFGKEHDMAEVNRGLVLFLLPVVIIVAFLLSKASVDFGSARYLTPLAFIIGLMAALLINLLWQKGGITLRIIVLFVATSLALSNMQHIVSSWAAHDAAKQSLDRLVASLDAKQIAYAYGDYWAAYLVDFYTNERIVIEPTYSNYCPHYAARVKAAQRIGYIARLPKKLDRNKGVVIIEGQRYLPLGEATEVDSTWEVSVLARL